MGALNDIISIFGIGILAYFGVKVILPGLNNLGNFQLPELSFPQAQAVPSMPSAPSPSTPTSSGGSNKQPNLTPTTKDMTSPNVAGTAFTFNVVGDVDYYDGTGQNLCGSNPTLVLIIGDFSYDTNGQKWWSTTMKACNGKNVMGSIGNHDGDGKNFIGLFPANGGKWTAMKKIGNIAFVSLNTGTCSAVCSNPSTEEPIVRQAQNDPSVKFIIVHFHKPVFTAGTSADAPMSFHTMLTKYPKVKMVFAGHNHTYKRYVPQNGIQYITAGRGGHDAAKGSSGGQKGASSSAVGVVKCRVGNDGAITCQYVANSGEVLDQWGLTAQGKHTGTGGVTPKQGSAAAESSNFAESFYSSYEPSYFNYDKETRDNAIIAMMDRYEAIMHPKRKYNNKIYHYSKYVQYY